MFVAVLLAGCEPAARRVPRPIGNEVVGAQAAAALRQSYRTPAFVVRSTLDGKRVAAQDTDLAPEAPINDTNLIIFAEGAGDTIEGFRATARLLAESPYSFAGAGDSLVILYLKWCQSTNVVAEHMNRAAQEAGAALLADMLEVHRRRHGDRGHVSLLGFSAGTRVIEIAFAGAAANKDDWHPRALGRVENVVFLGSSMATEESPPLEGIRGRFINFVNPRDTHFGDRAAYVATAGGTADPLKLLQQATIQRRPRFGASVAGFRRLPTLTAAEQFEAIQSVEPLPQGIEVRRAFKRINVPVPPTLVAFNLFGDALVDDDLDDYLNQAPNHYIMMGRGPGGRTDVIDFRQYRAASEEFVRELVASAAMRGRLYQTDLKSAPKGANPLGLPTIVPWAIFGEEPKSAPPADAGKPAETKPEGKPQNPPPK